MEKMNSAQLLERQAAAQPKPPGNGGLFPSKPFKQLAVMRC
jgi:hypothetical protein